ncbi:DUF6318 family protein [Cellulosimicrobium sp. CUA-896]|uniref:DUF6318 family protein n=1 Tax=Cellulosimicrobium sp. CUA-896 TaxID=1517881 RepID=UPI000960719B|nr:DUF6318 family protein [Cellulosimicrobium sp. CUA-896]OLT54635.1 hypothetical protein BJF88_07950 [Cellulosimicrobium sp. CUA-896]
MGLLVAGCSGEPAEPEPTTSTVEEEPTETPEPTPTETGPAKPERPAAMEQEDAEGAAAAAEYFSELYPYVMTSGDTSEWRSLAHESCGFCQGSIDQAETIRERGDAFVGGAVTATVEKPGLYARDEATGIFPLDMRIVQEAMTISDAEGKELFSQERTDDLYRAEIGRKDGEWVVVEVALLEQA